MKPIQRRNLTAVFAVGGVTALCGFGQTAYGQGCIVGHQCSTGAINGSNYLMPGEDEISLGYRGFTASRHFNGTVEQVQRATLKTFVINRQNIWDVVRTWGLSHQLSADVDVPWIHSGWSLPVPTSPTPGPRQQQDAQGIGDISLNLKYWLAKTETHPNGNIALGIGVKLPTGNDNAKDYFPKITGGPARLISVDQSIQPGDGGFGIPTSIEGFKTLGKLTVFATGNYLINPRDTNGTPSILASLGVPAPAAAPSEIVNSVPDQYLIRAGISGAIPWVKGLVGSVAWRKEGVPAKDLIGGSHGWRRPGFSTSIEPTLSYAVNRDSVWTVSIPVTISRDRVPTVADGVPLAGDATFADRQFIVNYAYRFGAGH